MHAPPRTDYGDVFGIVNLQAYATHDIDMQATHLSGLLFWLQLQAVVVNGLIIVDWAEELWQRIQDETWVLIVFIGCCFILLDIFIVLICICRYRCTCGHREKIHSDLPSNNVELRQVKSERLAVLGPLIGLPA